MKNNIVIKGSTTCRGFVADNLEFKIAFTIAALEDFKQCGVNVIEDRECGLCYNMYKLTGWELVSEIAHKCAPYMEGTAVPSGIVIYDPCNKEYVRALEQYSHEKLYEGRQLELRKEFAQLCIDYLKESIRI